MKTKKLNNSIGYLENDTILAVEDKNGVVFFNQAVTKEQLKNITKLMEIPMEAHEHKMSFLRNY